jgi:hypothetical protein
MIKRNTFLIISLLVVMALVFGAPEGADAKGFPTCPANAVQTVGPAVVGHIEFLGVGSEEYIVFTGRCGNNEIDGESIPLIWSNNEDGLLTEEELIYRDQGETHYATFQIPQTYVGPLADCFREDDAAFCLQFQNVRNFTGTIGDYSADVVLLRVVVPNH